MSRQRLAWHDRFGTASPVRIALAVFFLAFAVRVAAVLVTHQYRDQERFELERVALSLAQTGVFGNPYAIPTGPTAHVSPGYPILLAAIFRLFGTGTTAEIVKQIFASACSAAVCALIPALGGILRLPATVGLGAAMFTALFPIKIRTETEGDWETPFAALGLVLIIGLAVWGWRARRFDARFAILTGAVWGLVLLFVAAFLPLLPALFAVGFFAVGKAARRTYLRFAAMVFACVALLLSPWAIRNQIALGSPVIGRDNTGLELRISNNRDAEPGGRANYEHGLFHRYHPLQSVAEAMKVRDMGEIAYNRAAMAEARAWISSHPARFLRLCVERAAWFWFYPDVVSVHGLKPSFTFVKNALGWLYTALGLAGLIYLWKADRLVFAVVLTVLLVMPLPNYLIHISVRHRYAIDWLLVLLSGYTVWNLWPGKSAET